MTILITILTATALLIIAIIALVMRHSYDSGSYTFLGIIGAATFFYIASIIVQI